MILQKSRIGHEPEEARAEALQKHGRKSIAPLRTCFLPEERFTGASGIAAPPGSQRPSGVRHRYGPIATELGEKVGQRGSHLVRLRDVPALREDLIQVLREAEVDLVIAAPGEVVLADSVEGL